MGRSVRSSLRWSYGASLGGLVVQFVCVAIVGRLVAPADYGMAAVAGGVIGYLGYFCDLGIGQAAMRDRHLEPGDVWGVALVALAGNLVLVALIWAVAGPLARGLGLPPEGVMVLRVTACVAPLAGLSAAAQAWMARDMDFRRLGLVGLITKVVGQGAVVVPLAWAGLGVWALVAGLLAQPLAALLLGIGLARPRLPALARWRRILSLARLGGNFSVIRVLDASQAQAVTLGVAILAGTAAAGLYDRAALLSLVLADLLVANGLGRVLMPLYCRLGETGPQAVSTVFLSFSRRVFCLGFPVAAGVAAAAEPVVLTVLGGQWAAAAMPLRLLAAMAVCRMMAVMAGGVVEARGALRWPMIQGAGLLAGTVLALVLIRPDGLHAILVIAVAAELARAALLTAQAARVLSLSLVAIMVPVALAVSVAVPVAGAVTVMVATGAAPPACLGLAILAGGIVGGGVLAWHPDRTLRAEMRGLIPGILRRRGR